MRKKRKRNNDSRQRNMRAFMFMLHSEACDPLNGKEFRLNYMLNIVLGQLFHAGKF